MSHLVEARPDPALIVQVYDSGRRSVREVAERLAVHPRTVARHLEAAGVYTPRPATLTPDRLAQVQALLSDEAPFIEIERTTGVTYKTIRRYFPDAVPATAESRSIMAAIQKDAELRRVHREIQKTEVAA